MGTDKSLPLDCWRSAVGIQQSILNGLLIWWPFFSLRFSLVCLGNVDWAHTIDSVIDQTLASDIWPLINWSNLNRWLMQTLMKHNSWKHIGCYEIMWFWLFCRGWRGLCWTGPLLPVRFTAKLIHGTFSETQWNVVVDIRN